ncbi:MAG: hypothetical protein A3I68_08545 [Candidatus Melainabacteria bacterium RIFCSPLOWO2_02_FULL_35_15]|nr:MAG: hypothetical protein A3F80_06715 [Candidatus Melainabacteria bacterium RIFCSPLOWO2_12_FULL_35_11]OGI14017.1 MAG: hypothetical protein A3I68_08545 [Candidatus Melainabacteria bacterium RIFCSPLOWO2_02_FULL_35_15]
MEIPILGLGQRGVYFSQDESGGVSNSIDLQVQELSKALENASIKRDIGGIRSAARELGNVGDKASASVPTLISALKHESEMITQGEIVDALVKIGEKAAPALSEALHYGCYRVQRQALWALERLEEKALPAVPGLVKVLSARDKEPRTTAKNILEKLGYF